MLDEAIAEYEKKEGSLYQYTGDIPHFSFTNLVMDPTLAFDGDEYGIRLSAEHDYSDRV